MIEEHATYKALVTRLESMALAWQYWVGSLPKRDGVDDPYREHIDGLVVQLQATLDQLRLTLIKAGESTEPIEVTTPEESASEPFGRLPEQELGPPDTIPAYS